jgi:hypothetical protein
MMPRTFVWFLTSLAALHLTGCGGDDSVNPTNPDASTAKPGDASSDGPKEGHAGDAARDARDGSSSEAGPASDGGSSEGAADAGGDT